VSNAFVLILKDIIEEKKCCCFVIQLKDIYTFLIVAKVSKVFGVTISLRPIFRGGEKQQS